MADRNQHPSREDEIRRAVFDQVDLQTAELEIVGSIYDGFAAAIVVTGQPRTVALTREYGDAVQIMALLERGRTALPAPPGDGASLADHVYCPPGLNCPPIAEAASKPQGCGAIYAAAYDSIRKGAPGLSDATCAVIARSINMKAALSAQPQARDEAQPVRGEIRTIDGNRCRFIERELEGDKWEVIGPVVEKETAAPVREEGGAVAAAWRESFIADEEEGPVSGVVIDLPDGSQIWTGDCSNTLLDSMGDERPDESGQFLTVAIKGKPTRVVASVASTEDGIALARALASSLAPAEAGEDDIRRAIKLAIVANVSIGEGRFSGIEAATDRILSALRAQPQAREEAQPVAGLRPVILAFAHLMEAKLKENDWKSGWKKDSPLALLGRLREETDELAQRVQQRANAQIAINPPPLPRWHELIANEAADVANFAMMVADVCGGLPDSAVRSIEEATTPPAPEAEKMRVAIEALRSDEGDSVTILCDDPEADRPEDTMAVECCGAWTDWNDRRFYGRDVLDALTKAVENRKALAALQAGGDPA